MSKALTWRPGPRAPQLAKNEVHVWSVSLAASDGLTTRLKAHLSEDELQRASRYIADRHRRRFVVSRARQREILARYLNDSPANIRFRYDGLGKPTFDDSGHRRMRFNLSNSGDVTLLAITLECDIGVDVEKIREISNLANFSRRYFSQQECAVLNSLQPPERLRGFFRCWTRKEAILKATGKGLTSPLDQVVVSLHPAESAQLLSMSGDAERADEWWLAALGPAPGYIGAVAGKCDTPRLHCWAFAG